ncbi:DgyrCDS7051 [Dimorphilus gyrociliatus]|uniref:DgyrCDS7051 n=1 Tax=Dimorphilus gyrociliatus TaxID=2664684 RepID=A0A7I8VQJ4_9ANNE|nr:DgyrCDS7051 [Dimorphilus gyrociliatus]
MFVVPPFKPKFLSILKVPSYIEEHTSLTVVCNVTGLPHPDIVWLYNNEIVNYTKSNVIVLNNSLKFTQITRENTGNYSCNASNSIGSTQSKIAYINVAFFEVIFQVIPKSQYAVLGSKVMLHCQSPPSNPEAKIEWYKDLKFLVSGINKMSFQLENLTYYEEGNYRCTATNTFLGISRSTPSVQVIIKGKPVVTHHPQNQIAKQGRLIIFKCRLDSKPLSDVFWCKTKSEILKSCDKKLKESSLIDIKTITTNVQLSTGRELSRINSTLIFKRLLKDDEGYYFCQAENRFGTTTSNLANLFVIVSPVITGNLGLIKPRIDKDIVLYCYAQGSPVPAIYWYKDNVLLEKNDRIEMKDKQLIIKNLKSSDSGNYSCMASNLGGNTTTSGYLDLLSTQDNKIQISGSRGESLSILVLTIDYTGIFKCKAESISGITEESINVLVRGPPNDPKLLEVVPISSSSIQLIFNGKDQRESVGNTRHIVYFKELFEANFKIYYTEYDLNTTLAEIENLKPAKKYLFKMRSVNDVGFSEFSDILSATTFSAGPSKPTELQIVCKTSSCSLNWKLPAEMNGKITDFEIQYRRQQLDILPNFQSVYEIIRIPYEGSKITELNINDLLPYSAYEFRVRAATTFNDTKLWGDFSKIEVDTSEGVPTSPPENIYRQFVTKNSVGLSWQKILKEKRNGKIVGYAIRVELKNQTIQEKEVTQDIFSTIVTHLKSFRYYTIKIGGKTSVGIGPYASLLIQTLESIPTSPPDKFRQLNITKTNCTLGWETVPEEERNSVIIRYQISYILIKSSNLFDFEPTWTHERVSSKEFNITLRNLLISSIYNFCIEAISSKGIGPRDCITLQTLEDEPEAVHNLTIRKLGDTNNVEIGWNSPKNLNSFNFYYVVNVSSSNLKDDCDLIRQTGNTYLKLLNLCWNTIFNVSVLCKNPIGSSSAVVVSLSLFEVLDKSNIKITSRVPTLSTTNILENAEGIDNSERQYPNRSKLCVVSSKDKFAVGLDNPLYKSDWMNSSTFTLSGSAEMEERDNGLVNPIYSAVSYPSPNEIEEKNRYPTLPYSTVKDLYLNQKVTNSRAKKRMKNESAAAIAASISKSSIHLGDLEDDDHLDSVVVFQMRTAL